LLLDDLVALAVKARVRGRVVVVRALRLHHLPRKDVDEDFRGAGTIGKPTAQ
jgi:hypothetical protein